MMAPKDNPTIRIERCQRGRMLSLVAGGVSVPVTEMNWSGGELGGCGVVTLSIPALFVSLGAAEPAEGHDEPRCTN